jgi:hypothetical protein
MSFEQWEDALLWCSDTYLDSNLTTDGHVQQPDSSGRYGEDVVDETFTAWTSDTIDHDGCLDVVDLDFTGPKSPVKQEERDNDSQGIPLIDVVTSSSTRRNSSLAMVAPVSTVFPFPTIEFTTPAFAEFSQHTNRRALVDHFANVLSHLIVLREDEGNPFQQLVLPLSQKSPVVLNAVFALASAHLEHRGIHNSEKSIYFHNQAIRGLATLIAEGCDARRNELLAAIILLVYYEVVSC